MSAPLRFLLAMLLLVAGAHGWGSLLVVLVRRSRGGERAGELGAALRIALGLVLFLAVGGVAVAADCGGIAFLLGWQIAGTVLFVVGLFRRGQNHTPLVGHFAIAASYGLVGLAAVGVALAGPYNANDDGPAYLYLAQRLLSTGGLIDPFNTRRVNSYGGAELFQAIVLRFAGNDAGLGVEWGLFSVLLVALIVSGLRLRWQPLAVLLLGAGVVLVRPVGIWTNVAPTFSGAALTLALMLLVAGARRESREPWRFALAGLLLAGILALRFEFFLPAAVVLVIAAFTLVRGWEGLRAFAYASAVFVVAMSGWAVALERSSATPLFPLIVGNWTSADLWKNPAVHTFGGYIGRFVLGANESHWDVILIGSLLLTGLLLVMVRTAGDGGELVVCIRRSAVVLLAASAGCVLALASESVELSGAVPTDVGRYSAPSTLAVLAFVVALALRCADRRLVTPDARRRLAMRGVALLGALGLFLGALGMPLTFYGPAARAAVARGADVLDETTPLVDQWAAERMEYARLNAQVPRGAYVLAAVNEPALLDFARYRFTTLDVVGGSSPAPHLPLTEGVGPLVAYLQHLGITGVVATLTDRPGFYSLAAAEAGEQSPIYNYRASARPIVEWSQLIDLLSKADIAHRKRAGTLFYLPLAPLERTAAR